ncbi:hypothetical protein D3C84_1244210 [compost metagenome]
MQLRQRVKWSPQLITIGILAFCYFAGQIGFGPLLSTLYPLFGIISLGWLILIIRHRKPSVGPRDERKPR